MLEMMVYFDTGFKYAWGKLPTPLKYMRNIKYSEAVFEQKKNLIMVYEDDLESKPAFKPADILLA